MTLPDERLRALHAARDFLRDLLDRRKTPKIPLAIRREAYYRLKHYPMPMEIDQLASHRLLGGEDD